MTTVTEIAMKNVCKVFTFRPLTVGKLLSFLNTRRNSGGEGGGTAERQQGWKAAFVYTNMWGGGSWFYIYIFKIFILNTS